MRRESATSLSSRPLRSDPGWPASLGLLVLTWVVLCGVVVGFGWLLVHPLAGSLGRVDNDLARWFAEHRTPTLSDLATVGAFFGETLTGQVALVAVAVGFSVWQRSVLPAVFLALVEAGLLGIYTVATHVVPRPRPPVEILDPGLVHDHSFRSGHVATSIAVYGGIVVLTWTYAYAARWWATALLVLPLCVMSARMYQGAHHLFDVLTSLVYATVWLGAVTILVLRGRATPRVTAG